MDGKQLASPYLEGGGGYNFEHRVQAYFLLLMLSDGKDPIFNRPVVKLDFQARHHGYHIDDLVCYTDGGRKLLIQIKHSVKAVKSNKDFKETVQAAWKDFNSELFDLNRDRIVLVSGNISPDHRKAMMDLNTQARSSSDESDFLNTRINMPRFLSSKTKDVFDAIKEIITDLNPNEKLDISVLWPFFKVFSLLTFDLDYEDSINRSLILALLEKNVNEDVMKVWRSLCDYADECDKNSKVVMPQTVSEDINALFKSQEIELQVVFDQANELWASLALVGAWNESNEHDVAVVEQVTGCKYADILRSCLKALNQSNPWLSFSNKVWKICSQKSLVNICAGYITDHLINRAFEVEKKFLTQRSSRILEDGEYSFCIPSTDEFTNSTALRRGLTRGLCMVCNSKNKLVACSDDIVAHNAISFIGALFSDCDELRLMSMQELLKFIAEMDPGTYLTELEQFIEGNPKVVSMLFRRSRKDYAYIPRFEEGLIDSLQTLAWSEAYLTQSLCCFGMVADCIEDEEVRSFVVDGIAGILLPWHVQTLASADVQIQAVKCLGRTSPDILWPLLKLLVPGGKGITGIGRKPNYIVGKVPDEIETSKDMYVNLCQAYISMMFKMAEDDPKKLAEITGFLSHFNRDDFWQYLSIVQTKAPALKDEEKYNIWNELSDIKYRALLLNREKGETLDESTMEVLETSIVASEPEDIRVKYKRLYLAHLDKYFIDRSVDYLTNEKKKEFDKAEAVMEIYKNYGIDSVVDFGRAVHSSADIGFKLGQKLTLDEFNELIQKTEAGVLTVEFLAFILNGFITINSAEAILGTELKNCNDNFIASVLAKMRLTGDELPLVGKLLEKSEDKYWAKVSENSLVWLEGKDLICAIDHLRNVHRSVTALNLCDLCIYRKGVISSDLLLSLLEETLEQTDINDIKEQSVRQIIKELESRKSENIGDRLAKIEFSLLPMLEIYSTSCPDALFAKIGCDAELFCEFIKQGYKKRHQSESNDIELPQGLSQRLGILSMNFRAVPGTDWTGNFDTTVFEEWLAKVKAWAKENDRYEVAMHFVGQGISYAPHRDGVLIHESMIEALNDADAEEIRSGYILAVMNQRGAHFVDPIGNQEKVIADKFEKAAKTAQCMGYSRYSRVLKKIADNYIEEAQQIINEEKELKQQEKE